MNKKIIANKNLGQNFLNDFNKKQEILKNLNLVMSDKKDYKIIEIGPGLGALTDLLDLNNKNKIIAIEIDNKLIKELNKKEYKRTKLLNQDVLNTDFKTLFPKEDKINFVSNLPYYISTKIIFKALEDERIKTISIMLQKELADRISSSPNSKSFGRISVALGTFFKLESIIKVDRNCFSPSPNVDSSFLNLKRIENSQIKKINKKEYLSFIKVCFAQKRKTLINSLKDNNFQNIEKIKEFLIKNNISLNIRSENIDINTFVKMWIYL